MSSSQGPPLNDPSSSSKKRKRATQDSSSHPANGIRLTFAEESSDSLAPVLACAGALAVPAEAQFDEYKDASSQSSLIFGETKKQEWESRNQVRATHLLQGQKPDDAKGYHSQYMLAVYNKQTKSAQLVPAPVHIIAPTLKRLKHLNTVPTPDEAESRAVQRNVLGTAFGTKKAKANIRAAERARIDVSAADLQAYQPELQASLDDVLANLPTSADLEQMTASASLIPKPNLNAASPAEAYPIEHIATKEELAAMPIKAVMKGTTLAERMSHTPARQSAFVSQRLRALVHATSADGTGWDKPAKEKLRMMLYFSTLLAFKRVAVKVHIPEELKARLDMPDVVVEGLFARFTETRKDTGRAAISSATETKLLTYICAMALHLSDFSADLSALASDLNLPLTKIQDLFKSLGCTIVYPTKEEKEAYTAQGMTAKQIRELRKAAIRLPLSFPKPRKGRRKA